MKIEGFVDHAATERFEVGYILANSVTVASDYVVEALIFKICVTSFAKGIKLTCVYHTRHGQSALLLSGENMTNNR